MSSGTTGCCPLPALRKMPGRRHVFMGSSCAIWIILSRRNSPWEGVRTSRHPASAVLTAMSTPGLLGGAKFMNSYVPDQNLDFQNHYKTCISLSTPRGRGPTSLVAFSLFTNAKRTTLTGDWAFAKLTWAYSRTAMSLCPASRAIESAVLPSLRGDEKNKLGWVSQTSR